MAGFKDYIASDLSIFLNSAEFGETHRINGTNYTIIVDNDRLKERSKKEYDGITVGEILFFVAKDTFGSCPDPDAPILFDKRQMFVFDAREESGMYEIILYQNRGR